MKRAPLGSVLHFAGELHEVIAISTERTLVLQPLHRPPCEHCGCQHRTHVVESSRNFQEYAEPVQTVEGE